MRWTFITSDILVSNSSGDPHPNPPNTDEAQYKRKILGGSGTWWSGFVFEGMEGRRGSLGLLHAI